jgi:hypothetical protein
MLYLPEEFKKHTFNFIVKMVVECFLFSLHGKDGVKKGFVNEMKLA